MVITAHTYIYHLYSLFHFVLYSLFVEQIHSQAPTVVLLQCKHVSTFSASDYIVFALNNYYVDFESFNKVNGFYMMLKNIRNKYFL